jgi:hypothetical protein
MGIAMSVRQKNNQLAKSIWKMQQNKTVQIKKKEKKMLASQVGRIGIDESVQKEKRRDPLAYS